VTSSWSFIRSSLCSQNLNTGHYYKPVQSSTQVSRCCNSDFHIKMYFWAGIKKDNHKRAAGLFQSVPVINPLRTHQRWEYRACRCFTTGNNTTFLYVESTGCTTQKWT